MNVCLRRRWKKGKWMILNEKQWRKQLEWANSNNHDKNRHGERRSAEDEQAFALFAGSYFDSKMQLLQSMHTVYEICGGKFWFYLQSERLCRKLAIIYGWNNMKSKSKSVASTMLVTAHLHTIHTINILCHRARHSSGSSSSCVRHLHMDCDDEIGSSKNQIVMHCHVKQRNDANAVLNKHIAQALVQVWIRAIRYILDDVDDAI